MERIVSETTQCKMISADEKKNLQDRLPPLEVLQRLSEFFGVFADETRLKILFFLSQQELCVADLATLTQMGQSAISHQLKVLRLTRLVKYRKEKTSIFYSLDDDHIHSVFEVAMEHILEGDRK